eukprot:GFUD01139653.1.p1 GENE.GFUD01139653.1~~GFUD01139653.1.p1  ORF type:complete len:576 (+),score=193.84 GFUD01139653.1:124-1851(+)
MEQAYCRSPHTRRCCLVTGGAGAVFLLLGLLVLVAGPGALEKKILQTMALAPGSDRLQSWLVPPVQAHLTGYGFHVTNPEEVQQGEKPILKEVGPFVYKAVTVKDSVDEDTGKENLEYNEDGQTLTYRPRKFYFLDRSQSVGDPDTTFITIPNVPLLTGFRKIRDLGWAKGTAVNVIKKTGLGTPFINVSFSGLLWGYHDELPCMKQTRPGHCPPPEGEVDIFAAGDDEDEDDWGDDWKRKKRDTGRYKRDTGDIDLKTADFASLERPKAEIVDCKCLWGLFRDRNVTLRKPVKVHHGMADLSKKGWVEEFDSSATLNWWKPGSECDRLGGQDSSTLPPGWERTQSMDMFISLMCRRIKLAYEKDTSHLGLTSYRFIPPPNAMGSHTDPDQVKRNPDNSCFCLKEEGFSCFKSGVFNMEPCKRTPDLPLGAPIALSYPHFYEADQSFLDAVVGLKPNKEEHQFYVDVVPEFGFPLAIRPRFQLNAIIRKDKDIDVMSNFVDELVLPFLWAQDGFSEPSEEMAAAIKFGLAAPSKIASIGGGGLLVTGLVMVFTALGWIFWDRRRGQQGEDSLGMK